MESWQRSGARSLTFALPAPVLFFLAYEDAQRAVHRALDAAAI
jgi:hypothetical protein